MAYNKNNKIIRECDICKKKYESNSSINNAKYCQDCRKEAYKIKLKENYQRNRKLRLSKAKKYRKENNEKIKIWRNNNTKNLKKYRKDYCSKHLKEMNEYQKKYAKNNSKKIKARNTAKYKKTLNTFCEHCGKAKNLERHHPDYNKPLEIITLCRKCHRKLHNEI